MIKFLLSAFIVSILSYWLGIIVFTLMGVIA
jgi:hypothetical protein